MFIQILICFSVGLIGAATGKDTRIIGGVHANAVDFAFHASLRRISDNRHLCSGCIITRLSILTAAHCVLEPYISHANLKVVIGTSNITDYPGTTLIPDRIFIHPKFTGDMHEYATSHNDVAIVRVDKLIQFNRYQSPMNLPDKNIQHGDIGVISGWGSLTYPTINMPNTLMKTWMKVIDFKRCFPTLPFKMRHDQFCGFQQRGVGTCIGDNGGPLVNLNRVIGILSIVRPCATGEPDVYTNVYSHLEFIKIYANLID